VKHWGMMFVEAVVLTPVYFATSPAFVRLVGRPNMSEEHMHGLDCEGLTVFLS